MPAPLHLSDAGAFFYALSQGATCMHPINSRALSESKLQQLSFPAIHGVV